MFHDRTARHLAAIYHCAYAGFHESKADAKPALVTWAPAWSGEAAKTPLMPECRAVDRGDPRSDAG